MGYYGGMHMGWIILCTIAVVTIVALVVWATMHTGNSSGVRDERAISPDNALETLERRFAKGEIDDSEYQRRRQLLTQH